MFGLPDLGISMIDLNPFDEPKKTSMTHVATNLCLCMCCAMIAKSAWSNPLKFRVLPILACLVLACCCTSLTGKNLYDEGWARVAEMNKPDEDDAK